MKRLIISNPILSNSRREGEKIRNFKRLKKKKMYIYIPITQGIIEYSTKEYTNLVYFKNNHYNYKLYNIT